MVQRSWVEIDLEIIATNVFEYQKYIDFCDIMAIIKADAYGHGASRIAKKLVQCGIKSFGVSNLEEALELRNSGIKESILVLGYTPVSLAGVLYENDIVQTVLSLEYAEELKAHGFRNKVQIAIDTGMNRIGLDANEPELCDLAIRMIEKNFEVTGVFTHLSVADTPKESAYTEMQLSKFKEVIKHVEDLKIPYVHCMNSAGGIGFPMVGNLVRLGIVLYGLKPDINIKLPETIKPAMTWKSVITMVKDVKAGESIGYGRSYKANEDMKVATVSTGYADGYMRNLSNKGYVLLNGRKAPVIGKICMDQFMIDVTHVNDVKMGNEVILLGKNAEYEITADDMGAIAGTIGYEVICGISKRVPRIYLNCE